jgi:hypothetical protein
MLLTFTYPVIASARTPRSETIKKVVGTGETPIEIAEFDASEVEPAFDIHGKPPIVSIRGRLWRKSELDVNLLSRSLSHLAQVPQAEIALIDTDFQMALMELSAGNRNLVVPKPPSSFSSSYLGNAESMEFLEKAGPLAQRKLNSLDEGDVDIWRARMTALLDNYAVVGGVTYQRCHEPLMIVDAGQIKLDDSSIFQRHINRIAFTEEHWVKFPDQGIRSHVHAFPADAEDEVMQFSGQLNGGDALATWFSIDCHGKCSSLGTVLEQETCRFTMMHALYFSEVDRKFRARFGNLTRAVELDRDGSDFGTYARAATRAAEAVRRHQTVTPCPDDVTEAFENLVAVASSADKLFQTAGDRHVWDKLRTNTDHMRSRFDDLPISLSVARNHAPKP